MWTLKERTPMATKNDSVSGSPQTVRWFRRRRLWISIGLAITILVAMVAWNNERRRSAATVIVKPKFGRFEVTLTTTGELRAKKSTKIYAPSEGQQIGIYQMKIADLVPEGTKVKQGDFVAELDRSELLKRIEDQQKEFDKAQTQFSTNALDTSITLSGARDNLVNLKYVAEESMLRKEQSAFEAPSVKRQAEIDYEKAVRAFAQAESTYSKQVAQAVAKMKIAEADLHSIQSNLGKSQDLVKKFTITAPANGIVVFEQSWHGKVSVGSQIEVWNPIVATLPDLSQMEVITWVSEVDVQKMKVDQKVKIGLDADVAKKLEGTVSRVANMGEGRGGTESKVYEVDILVTTSDTTLLPGMTTNNTIQIATIDSVLSVPLEAIHADSVAQFVYVKDGLRTIRQEVVCGQANENAIIIIRGISKSDLIYVSMPPRSNRLPLMRLPGTKATAGT